VGHSSPLSESRAQAAQDETNQRECEDQHHHQHCSRKRKRKKKLRKMREKETEVMMVSVHWLSGTVSLLTQSLMMLLQLPSETEARRMRMAEQHAALTVAIPTDMPVSFHSVPISWLNDS